MITLHVKTPKDKKTVQIEDNAVIKDVSVFSALVSLTGNTLQLLLLMFLLYHNCYPSRSISLTYLLFEFFQVTLTACSECWIEVAKSCFLKSFKINACCNMQRKDIDLLKCLAFIKVFKMACQYCFAQWTFEQVIYNRNSSFSI